MCNISNLFRDVEPKSNVKIVRFWWYFECVIHPTLNTHNALQSTLRTCIQLSCACYLPPCWHLCIWIFDYFWCIWIPLQVHIVSCLVAVEQPEVLVNLEKYNGSCIMLKVDMPILTCIFFTFNWLTLTSEMHFLKFHPEVASCLLSRGKRKVCTPGDEAIMKIHKKLFSGILFNFTLFVISPKL